MTLLKPSQVAADLGMSRFAIYNWIETGIIPEDCVVRMNASIRIDGERLEALVREGKLRRQRQHAPRLRHPEGAFMVKTHPSTRGNAARARGRDREGPPRDPDPLRRLAAAARAFDELSEHEQLMAEKFAETQGWDVAAEYITSVCGLNQS
jgi:hypothetical protein